MGKKRPPKNYLGWFKILGWPTALSWGSFHVISSQMLLQKINDLTRPTSTLLLPFLKFFFNWPCRPRQMSFLVNAAGRRKMDGVPQTAPGGRSLGTAVIFGRCRYEVRLSHIQTGWWETSGLVFVACGRFCRPLRHTSSCVCFPGVFQHLALWAAAITIRSKMST